MNDLESIMLTLKLHELESNERVNEIIYLPDKIIDASKMTLWYLSEPKNVFDVQVAILSEGMRMLRKSSDHGLD